ncbi:MAG: UDP-N-acetylmuramate:L-alanyl-gamma-D-glutamyl-meso-diaminopimelate ligase [Myxococcales bacterium]|nr:UDP-N-acetylmuramate:L-alanyl-gamma-D-glutamyl-meso-diaminopimelate ligase [Myxococcales bacterium]
MKIHMVAICGTGMGSLAGMLAEAGHAVRGSDRAFYPPMSERLRAWGIPTFEGFDGKRLSDRPDLVIVGNACRPDNPEARAALDMKLRVMSFPQALAEFFIGEKCSLVVAGTHGKTTSAALLAFLLRRAGRDPSFLVGGIPKDFGKSFHHGAGAEFVVEGDEYDTAFFDKRPKFVHYRPRRVLLIAVGYDHADIYPDRESYRAAFGMLLSLLPPDGELVACRDDPGAREIARSAPCPVRTYGLAPGPGLSARDIADDGSATTFTLVDEGRALGRFRLAIPGRHNVQNALGALSLARGLGLDPAALAAHLADFAGVARRLEVRGEAAGVTVLDDFAHHPVKTRESVAAARLRYPGRHLVAVFEPRTNTSRRAVFQQEYRTAFDGADEVILVPPFEAEKIPAAERFDSAALAGDLTRAGIPARCLPDTAAVIRDLQGRALSGWVVLVMSNGAFDDIHRRLLEALAAREGAR